MREALFVPYSSVSASMANAALITDPVGDSLDYGTQDIVSYQALSAGRNAVFTINFANPIFPAGTAASPLV